MTYYVCDRCGERFTDEDELIILYAQGKAQLCDELADVGEFCRPCLDKILKFSGVYSKPGEEKESL